MLVPVRHRRPVRQVIADLRKFLSECERYAAHHEVAVHILAEFPRISKAPLGVSTFFTLEAEACLEPASMRLRAVNRKGIVRRTS